MNNLAIWMRLIGLSAAWGMAFLFIRIAVPALGPIWLVEMRVLIAGCILLAWIMYRGQHLRLRQHALLYLKLGALNSAFPFMLVAWGEIELTASLSAVLIATTPLFTAVLVSSQSGRPLGWARAAGLILGLCGVIVLTGGVVTLAVTPNHLFAVLALLAAALCYALAAIYTARMSQGIPPLHLATGSQFGAALILAALLPWAQTPLVPNVAVVLAVFALAMFSSAAAFLLYFHLIQEAGSVATTTVNFLSPLFGVIGGHLWLHEALTPGMLLGAALVLGGSYLVLRRPRFE
jgi:drug/metabolite transporter (DMT)-like permease